MRRMDRAGWPVLLAIAFPAFGADPFAWKDLGDGRLELREGGKPALVYNHGPQLREGAPENRRRCCYVFPAYTPAGVSLLDDFPRDHWHHRGLHWAWPIVETQGKRYDLWMAMTARHSSEKTPVVSVSPKEARLIASNRWVAGERDIVRENVRITVYPSRDSAREIDFDFTWEALDAPVTLRGSAERGKSYGGFSARFAERTATVLRADDQVLSKDEDLNPRRWAELEGVFQGKRAVLRITSDSANPGAPHQWCLRAYGFVGASFPGRTETVDGYTMEAGKPLNLKFRVRISDLP